MNGISLGVGGVRVFEARQRVGWQAAGFLAGGIVFFLLLILQFLLLLGRKSTPANDMMPGVIGGLSVFGIALIGRGIFLLRGVTRVILDDAAVHVEGFIARRSVAYAEIERVARDRQTQLLAGKTSDVLLLRAAGETRPLAIIPDTIGGFEELAIELAERAAAARGGRSVYDPAADDAARQTRESRQLRLVSIGMSVFALLFLGAFCYGVYEEVHDRRLRSRGTQVDAQVSQRFMRRVTPYIAYTFRDAQGRVHSREVMVSQPTYDATDGARTIPVVYLPDEPDWNRLAAGDASTDFGGKSLFLFGGGALVFGGLAVMTLLGIDIKSDNGHTRIVRHGRVIREWGKKPAAQSSEPPALPTLADDDGRSDDDGHDHDRDDRVADIIDAAYLPSPPLSPPSLSPVPTTIAPARPTGLLVLGVLCLLFGLGGFLLHAANWWIDSRSRTRELNVGNEVMVVEQPAYAAYWSAADAALAALLILTGIGLLMLKRWSRVLGIPVAALQILSSLAAIAIIVAAMATAPAENGPDSMTVVTFNVAAVVAKVLSAIFPAVLLFILAKRSTRGVLK